MMARQDYSAVRPTYKIQALGASGSGHRPKEPGNHRGPLDGLRSLIHGSVC